MAIGTAVRRVDGMAPASATLIPQALIVERDTIEAKQTLQERSFSAAPVGRTRVSPGASLWQIAFGLFFVVIFLLGILSSLRH